MILSIIAMSNGAFLDLRLLVNDGRSRSCSVRLQHIIPKMEMKRGIFIFPLRVRYIMFGEGRQLTAPIT